MAVYIDDVAVELARPTPDSPVAGQWVSWIARAYRLIENRLGADAYAAADSTLVDDVVLMAVVEHVRAWRETPEQSRTVSVDDTSVTSQYARSAGLLTIPDNLWPILGQSVTAESFTIEP
jgi:hypothetical protein